jgi:hypothetical protein
MSYERACFIYAGSPGSELVHTNYFYVPYFPSCQTTGDLICSVKGIFDWETYEYHPASFSLDTTLGYYILDALGDDRAKPSGTGQRAYVYVKEA